MIAISVSWTSHVIPCLRDISWGRGFSRRSNKEFIQFLFISKGSAAEVQSQLYTALDQGYIPQGDFDGTSSLRPSRQLSDFLTHLSSRRGSLHHGLYELYELKEPHEPHERFGNKVT